MSTRHPGSSAECHAARDHRSNQAIAHIWTFGNPGVHRLPDLRRVLNRQGAELPP